MVQGRRQPEQFLQKHVQVRGGLEIPSAHHMGYPLQGVVDHDGEVVARRDIAPDDDRVAPAGRVGFPQLGPSAETRAPVGKRPRNRAERHRHVETPGVRLRSLDAARHLVGRAMPAGPGIERSAVWVARPSRRIVGFQACDGLGKFFSRTEAGIDKSPLAQRRECRAIILKVFGLPADRLLPPKTEPTQILFDRRREFGAAAGDVDILVAKQQAAVQALGELRVEQRRIGVPDMQAPVRAGSESKNGDRHSFLRFEDEHSM